MDNLFRFLILSNLLLVIFYPVYRWLLAGEMRLGLNRLVLTTVLLLALLIPLIPVNGLFSNLEPVILVPSLLETLREPLPDVELGEVLVGNASPGGFSVADWLLLFVLTGAGLRLLSIVISTSKLVYWRMTRPSFRHNGVFITLVPEKHGAFSAWGRIWLPDNFDLSTREAAWVIQHERVHLREGHSWDLVLMEAVIMLTFYNPVVYLLRKELQLNHEYRADRHSGAGDRYQYSMLLLNSQFRVPRLQLVHSFNQPTFIKRRFIMLTRDKGGRYSALKYLLLLPLFAGFVAFCAVTEVIGQEKKTVAVEKADLKKKEQLKEEQLKKEQIEQKADLKKDLETDLKEDHEIFYIVEEMPTFNGGDLDKFRQWVQSEVKYPEEAKTQKLQGTVYVNFVIGSSGKVANISIVRSGGELLDKEVIRVIKNAPVWVPGKQRGKNVAVSMSIPVKFVLEEKK